MSLTFDELVRSRREWIDTILKPWCRNASRKELILAEQEWPHLAGKVDSEATLWTWAWSRFDSLVCEGLKGVNETQEVSVRLKTGEIIQGYPEGRLSLRGELFLVDGALTEPFDATELGPFSIDEIAAVTITNAAHEE